MSFPLKTDASNVFT